VDVSAISQRRCGGQGATAAAHWALAALLGAFVLLANAPSAYARQSTLTCKAAYERPSVHVSLGFSHTDGTLEANLAETTPYESAKTSRSLVYAIGVDVHIAGAVGLRAEFSGANAGVNRYTAGAKDAMELPRAGLGSLSLSRFLVGFTRSAEHKGRNCGYVGASAGVFEFDYGRASNRAAGVAGFFAYERLLNERSSALVEGRIQAAFNGGHPPFLETSVFSVAVTAGVRIRF
jgi:hypothetical protein